MSISQASSTIQVYSSNLPNLFIHRHSECNKHLRNLENYNSDRYVNDGLLVSHNDILNFPSEEEKFREDWTNAQKKYFEQHKDMLARIYLQALKGVQTRS